MTNININYKDKKLKSDLNDFKILPLTFPVAIYAVTPSNISSTVAVASPVSVPPPL